MKIVMTRKELTTAIREQVKSNGDVIHYRDLGERKYAIVDHDRWQQTIDIEIEDEK